MNQIILKSQIPLEYELNSNSPETDLIMTGEKRECIITTNSKEMLKCHLSNSFGKTFEMPFYGDSSINTGEYTSLKIKYVGKNNIKVQIN